MTLKECKSVNHCVKLENQTLRRTIFIYKEKEMKSPGTRLPAAGAVVTEKIGREEKILRNKRKEKENSSRLLI